MNTIESQESEKKDLEISEFLAKVRENPNIVTNTLIIQEYKSSLDKAFEKAFSNIDYFYIVSELLSLKILNSEEINVKYKDKINNLLNYYIEVIENYSYDDLFEHLLLILELNIFDKNIIIKYQDLLYRGLYGKYPSLYNNISCIFLKSSILNENEKKNMCKKILDYFFEKVKDHIKFEYIDFILSFFELNILNENEIKEYEERYKNLLERLFKGLKNDLLVFNYISSLLQLNILNEDKKIEFKTKFKELAENFIENTFYTSDYYISAYLILELLKLNIYKSVEGIKKFLVFYNKTEGVQGASLMCEFLKFLYKEEISDIDKKDICKRLLVYYLELGTYDKILELSVLLDNDEILKRELKDKYKELLNKLYYDKYKYKYFSKLLELNFLDSSDKNYLIGLLKDALVSSRFDNSGFDNSGLKISKLIKKFRELKIISPDLEFLEIPENIGFNNYSFIEKYKDKITEDDIKFIQEGIYDIFTGGETNFFLKNCTYEEFKNILNNYKKIWKIKSKFYLGEERRKLKELQKYFGDAIWTYFFNKVDNGQDIKNRFRDPHNALLNYDKIIQLSKELEEKRVSKDDFINNYLGVAGDRTNGYQQLNDFLGKYYTYKNKYGDWHELVKKLNSLKNEEFDKFIENLLKKDKKGDLYSSIDELENINILYNLFDKYESLIRLQELRGTGNLDNDKLYDYYSQAIFHPRTKPVIMKMYENPKEFLGMKDTTFGDLKHIHESKKPSNMVERFEYLDFTAEDLVNCLPLGIYDQVSYFKPFEMKFYHNSNGLYTEESLIEEFIKIFETFNNKKVSSIITNLNKSFGDISYNLYKNNKEEFFKKLFEKINIIELIKKLINFGYSDFNKFQELKLYTAKITEKSDPNNWFNGFNCDSLQEGHGKKVVAMFNPFCTDFCVYEGEQDPEEDNLKVTSWVTLNRKIPQNFNELLTKVKSSTTRDIAEVLGDKFEDYKDPEEYIITMDNIEANPNFGQGKAAMIKEIYKKFFSEYIRQNPISPNGIPINTQKYNCGMDYGKLNLGLERESNETLQVFVNAYTDNAGDKTLVGELDAGKQIQKVKKTGIHPLTIEDVVQISYLEGKIYPRSLKNFIGNMQHEITASTLNNKLKNRQNLSFALYNSKGEISGYILAYQGVYNGKPGIYISDFAINEKERGVAGGKMILHWMNEVKKHYPDMPIFANAREATSYPIVLKHLEKFGYEITENTESTEGGENFHFVVLEPVN